MPELPEVETFARQIRPRILNKIIKSVVVNAKGERMTAPAGNALLLEKLTGAQFISLSRHGKFLIFALDNGWYIIAHLRMSGRFTITSEQPDPHQHNRIYISFADGTYLNFLDMRRFGTFHLVQDHNKYPGLQRLGPDALDSYWNAKNFQQALSKHHKAIYKTLLDQNVISGIGNIYANEALFRSKLHPLKQADTLTVKRSGGLLANVVNILSTALEFKGTTLLDHSYTDSEGKGGTFRELLQVYARAGKPCLKCGSDIVRMKSGGRSVFYCPHCQQL
jgi:formamidopyrimidine-DNA glycosylase